MTKPVIFNKQLNHRQKLFVEAYCGDSADAAIQAGYSGTMDSMRRQGDKLLSDPTIMECIKARSRYLNKMGNAVASREERQMMWTAIMNNEDPHHREEKDSNGIPIPKANLPMNMRLKASELLGKSEGDFVERIDINANVSISDIISESYQVGTEVSLDSIEAQYREVRAAKKELEDKQSDVDYGIEPDEDENDNEQSLDDLI